MHVCHNFSFPLNFSAATTWFSCYFLGPLLLHVTFAKKKSLSAQMPLTSDCVFTPKMGLPTFWDKLVSCFNITMRNASCSQTTRNTALRVWPAGAFISLGTALPLSSQYSFQWNVFLLLRNCTRQYWTLTYLKKRRMQIEKLCMRWQKSLLAVQTIVWWNLKPACGHKIERK
jgi:hypothetical protein